MKKMMIAAALMVPAWSAASAQEAPVQVTTPADTSGVYRVRLGAGAQLRPKFPGAGKGELSPLFHVNIARGNELFKFSAPDDSTGIAIFDSNGFAIGPVVNLASGRKDKDVGLPLGRVKTTFEVGGFADYMIGKTIRLRGELRKGINGHNGLIGQMGADRIWRNGDKYVFSIGPRLVFADSTYQRAFYGVKPAVALATGLPTYRPDGGIHALGLATGFNYQFDDQFGLFDYARYERLVGDAAKSPIVRQLGSRNQVSVGLGLSYTFAVRP
jgi:outer membrane protein